MGENNEKYTLNIFSGLHQGAKIPLIPGNDVLIGSGRQCNVILNDDGIASEHMVLSCDIKRFFVHVRDGTVYIDGKKVTKAKKVLQPLMVITLGSVHLGIAYENYPWFPETFPQINADGQQKKPESDETAPPSPFQAINKANLKHFIMAGAFVAILSIILFFMLKGGDQTVQDSVQIINHLFTSMNLPEPQVSINENNKIVIKGYAKNTDEKNMLVEEFDKLKIPIHHKIYVDEKLHEECERIITNLRLSVTVTYKEFGNIALKGFVNKHREIEVLLLKLKQDLPGIQNIDNHVWAIDEMIPKLVNIVTNFGLNNKVQFERYPDYFLASGTLNKKELFLWKEARLTIEEKYGDYLVIKTNFKDAEKATPKPGKISLPIKSVTVGEISYITLKGGKIYFEGGTLQDGMVIKKIKSDRIIVERNGREYTCDLE